MDILRRCCNVFNRDSGISIAFVKCDKAYKGKQLLISVDFVVSPPGKDSCHRIGSSVCDDCDDEGSHEDVVEQLQRRYNGRGQPTNTAMSINDTNYIHNKKRKM